MHTQPVELGDELADPARVRRVSTSSLGFHLQILHLGFGIAR